MNVSANLLCQWFPPEPVILPLNLAEALIRQGLHIEVITGQPNYPTGVVAEGYRAFRRSREEINTIPVHRTPLYPSHDSSAVKRIANYLSWAGSSTVMAHRQLTHVDVNLVYASPATAALGAWRARRSAGTPYVLLAQDIWPDSILASGLVEESPLWRTVSRVLDHAMRTLYRSASHIVVISPSAVDLLVDRGVQRDRITLVYNWADEALFRPTAPERTLRAELGIPASDFVLLYAGNHGRAQALGTAIAAIPRCPENVHLLLIGDGVEKPELTRQAQTTPGRIHFMPSQPAARIAGLSSAADAQLISLADSPLFRLTMPSKIQAALACGSPLIASAPGDAARIVRDAEAGIAVHPGDSQSLAAAITRMSQLSAHERRAMGQAARTFYEDHMSEAIGARALAEVLRTAAEEKTS